MNDSGQLVFSAFFTDSTAGVFVVDMNTELAGDFNNDGTVDAADYIAWQKGLVPQTQPNYNLWRKNFGSSIAGSGSGDSSLESDAAVPEPALCSLIVAAASCLFAFNHRSS